MTSVINNSGAPVRYFDARDLRPVTVPAGYRRSPDDTDGLDLSQGGATVTRSYTTSAAQIDVIESTAPLAPPGQQTRAFSVGGQSALAYSVRGEASVLWRAAGTYFEVDAPTLTAARDVAQSMYR